MKYTSKIVDGHLDIAWNWQSLGREFASSVVEKAKADSDEVREAEGTAAVGLPELIRGNFGVVVGSLWVEPSNSAQPTLGKKYRNLAEARRMALEQLDYYYEQARHDHVRLILSRQDLVEVLLRDGLVGIALAIEGADFLRGPEDLDFWYSKGVRLVGPVWQANAYGGCSVLGGPLTSQGRRLLAAMAELGMILDIAHMSQECADDALDFFNGVAVSSHSACRMLSPGERQTSDSQVRKIHESGGIIGMMLWDRVINPGRARVDLDHLWLHLVRVQGLVGGWDSVGLGTSLDGGFGTESLPEGMADIGDCSKIGTYLLGKEVAARDVEKVMYRKWGRVLLSAYDE